MSVDLSALSSGSAEARMRQLFPNLVMYKEEPVAAIARPQQQQQQQQQHHLCATVHSVLI
jgi:hypothetical protein